MASITSNLDLVIQAQPGKETTANELWNSMSVGALFGRRNFTSTLLTWGYYGGPMVVDGALTVTKDSVVLDAKLGFLLSTFKHRIEEHVNDNFDRYFA